MLLAIDAGNTNIVFAVLEGREKKAQWRAVTDPKRTPDEYAVWLTQLMTLEGMAMADIDGAIIASVVPAAMYGLTTLCRRYVKTEPLVVGDPAVDLGLEVRIERPDQVGADRLVNAVAAYEKYGGGLIIVDFGTATTFDIVGGEGAYEGSIIAPGVNLSLEALYNAAAKLPRISIERPAKVIAGATIPAMQSGVYWGYVGLIEGLIKRIRREDGRDLRVIATGGLAPLFTEVVEGIEASDAELTVAGLALIYERNKAAAG